MEQVTLMEVKNDGQTLVLIDGKELHVDPRAITTAIRWLPSTLLRSRRQTPILFSTSASKSMAPLKRSVPVGHECWSSQRVAQSLESHPCP